MQGLYFLYQDNELTYIGKSTNIPNRLSNHNKQFDS
jgi:predicted GIY-YIG superfamily endonuclease